MVTTLSEPTADQITKNIYNRGMAIASKLNLNTDQLYALCLIKLNNSVVPGDYPALKTAIEVITGVQEITLVIDHHTRTSVPANTQLSAYLEMNLRIDDV